MSCRPAPGPGPAVATALLAGAAGAAVVALLSLEPALLDPALAVPVGNGLFWLAVLVLPVGVSAAVAVGASARLGPGRALAAALATALAGLAAVGAAGVPSVLGDLSCRVSVASGVGTYAAGCRAGPSALVTDVRVLVLAATALVVGAAGGVLLRRSPPADRG